MVFDGYTNGPSTKDSTQRRRAGLCIGVPVQVSGSMIFTGKKQDFLSNKQNKQNFKMLLAEQDSMDALQSMLQQMQTY